MKPPEHQFDHATAADGDRYIATAPDFDNEYWGASRP
jgi:hypothetical protein